MPKAKSQYKAHPDQTLAGAIAERVTSFNEAHSSLENDSNLADNDYVVAAFAEIQTLHADVIAILHQCGKYHSVASKAVRLKKQS